ncbi:NfrA family protein [Ralstonia insidiosa]|uniref:Bacteriophage N4 adsorption protein A n=1 Tax=Ralstonia insidiosa TaxID=190721 RepID=A0A848P5N1_9RALS|nr:tetratricopeptide repeat protein [Ralstonia insidiosa]NMV40605.1 bacteriophage N4 adsorption protein A [Ralstonia insidiosa]
MKTERIHRFTLRGAGWPIKWPIAAAVWALCHGVSVAEQTAQPLQPDAYFRADRAYHAIDANKLDDAEAATRAALAVQPDSLQLNLLLLDVLTRKGRLDAARTQADALVQKYPNEPRVYAQHGFLAQKANDSATAEQDFAHATQGTDWTPQEQRNLHLAWSDSAYSARHPQAALDALSGLQDQPDAGVQLRLAQSRLQLGDRDGATRAATLAEEHATDPAQKRYAKALLAEAMAPQVQSVATSPDDPRVIGQRELNEAYGHLRARDDRAALAAFQRGFATGQGNWSHYADAAYAAKRLGDNPTAITLFRKSLDVADADAKSDGGSNGNDSLPADRRFGYRREVEQMQRTWGMVLSGAYQTSAFGVPNTVSVFQGGAEVYWQPPGIGYRDGSIFQLFVRGYDNLYDGNGIAGLPTAQGSVGARYKPVKDLNLVFTAERLIRIGTQSVNDTLLRIGFSTDQGIDLQVTKPRWQTWQAYGEGAYFLNQGRMIISTEARYGHTWLLDSISDHLTVYPHVVLAGDHDNKATDRQLALGAGPGINFRYWFRESQYSAPASWLDLTVQYRLPLTHADRAKGVVARAILWF